MKKKKTNPWTIVGITIAIILLIYWLLAATILEEDENVIPILDGNYRVKRYFPRTRKKQQDINT